LSTALIESDCCKRPLIPDHTYTVKCVVKPPKSFE
jgi:hypothetical protein